MESTLVKTRDEVTTSLRLALQLKWEREVYKLRDLLKRRLQRDLQKLFEEKSFTNVIFETNDEVKIESHSAILKARVPCFYRFCVTFCQLKQQHLTTCIQLRGVNGSELHNFLRQVYCGEDMEELEDEIVQQLQSFVDEIETVKSLSVVEDEIVKPNEELGYGMELENVDVNKCSDLDLGGGDEDMATGGWQNVKETLLDLHTGEFQDSESFHSGDTRENAIICPSSLCPDSENIELNTNVSVNVGSTAFEFQEEKEELSTSGVQCGNNEHDLIVFDEVGGASLEPSTNEMKIENTVSVLESELESAKSIALIQITKEIKPLELTKITNESPESEAPEMSISLLKLHTGLDALDLKLGSKDGQAMILSHDSGMCSDSRKLSTSSVGQPIISPCSENVADSSNESLPKDDSLECCLDSLTNDEMNESSVFGGTESVSVSSQNLNATSSLSHNMVSTPVENTFNQMSASFPSTSGIELSSWKSIFAKRYSWLDIGEDNENKFSTSDAQRRWSLSSVDSDQKTANVKPAAVVTPYNANMDLQLVFIDQNTIASSQQLTDNVTSFSDIVRTPDTPSQMSVVSFVPFLREEHHIQERTLASSSSVTFFPTPAGAGSVPVDSFSEESPIVVEDVRRDGDVVSVASPPMRPDAYRSDTASDVVSQPFTDSEVSTGLASVNVCLTPADKVGEHRETPAAYTGVESGGHPPPPVYMYIAAECQSPSRPRPAAGKGHLKVGEFTSRDVPLRRKVLGAGAMSRRPKSETSASLFKQFDGRDRRNKSTDKKRVSLTLDDDVESIRSLEGHVTMTRSTERTCSKLGDDLLKMFLNEIDPDVTIIVKGKEIKAHKSVLSSRCVYFAAAMSGNWVESSGNVISMSGFSYEAVHFAIYHIYSGASAIPENIDISELASLADMLGFEGLKDVVALALKMKYCHFFHKPCAGCSTTVSECFLIAASFGLDELQEKCLRWINKYLLKTWPTKSFAALPDELLQKCLAALKLDIATETVLDLIVRCDKLSAALPRVKWVEPVASITRQLSEACALYLSENLAEVICSRSFLDLRTGHTWSIHVLEPCLLIAAENTSLNAACRAFVKLHVLKSTFFAEELSETLSPDVNENFDLLVTKIHRQMEHFIIHNANRVVRCPGWALLSPELQQRIKDAAVIVFEFGKPTAAPPKLSSQNKKFSKPRTSCSSTASGSPVVWHNRVGVNSKLLSKSLHLTLEEKSKQEGRTLEKAATLPRTSANKIASGYSKEEKTDQANKLKNGQPNRLLSNNVGVGKSHVNANQPCASGIQRPKSCNLKERGSSVAVAKVRDKPATRELSHSSKSLIPNSISLRSASGISRVSVNYRSKSTSYNGEARPVKVLANCANGNELCGKENKDEKKNTSSITRSRAEDSPRPGLRKIGQRTSLARASCSSSLKV